MLCSLATVVLATYVWMPVMSQYDPSSHLGTTYNIEKIFVGRCLDYEVTKYKRLLPRVETDCESLWEKFFGGFSYKSPCSISMTNYEAFLDAAMQKLPEDKVMFWSGIYNLAHRFSEAARRYVTLEDTLVGYLVNNITWCGQNQEPGMNMFQCPAWDECPQEASESYWAAASKKFASFAKGKVTVMLDGSNPNRPAFRPNSIFGKFEVPSMSKDVTSIDVVVVHSLNKPVREKCGRGSLKLLEKAVKAAGFEYSCQDNPAAVLHLMCSDDPEDLECFVVQNHMYNRVEPVALTSRPRVNERLDEFV